MQFGHNGPANYSTCAQVLLVPADHRGMWSIRDPHSRPRYSLYNTEIPPTAVLLRTVFLWNTLVAEAKRPLRQFGRFLRLFRLGDVGEHHALDILSGDNVLLAIEGEDEITAVRAVLIGRDELRPTVAVGNSIQLCHTTPCVRIARP